MKGVWTEKVCTECGKPFGTYTQLSTCSRCNFPRLVETALRNATRKPRRRTR